MSRVKRVEKKELRESVSLWILVSIFSLISFYTSYTGLLKLSGVAEENYVLKVFMGVLVGGLQFALVFSVNAFHLKDLFRSEWFKAIALLIIYVITMLLSVTFSFSYWYEEFSAESYAKRSSELQLNRVKESLVNAKSSFTMMEKSLNKLSAYSTSESNRERLYGRTCNPRVGSGEGVYTWLRADDASETKSYSSEVEILESKLDREIANVSKFLDNFDPKGDVVSFNRKVNEKIKMVNSSFFENDMLLNLKSMLIKRSGSNRRHLSVVSTKTGEVSTQSCLDKDFTFGAKKVIAKIEALTPIEPLTFFDMSDTKKLFGRTVGVLKALITPAYTIKDVDDMSDPNDITYDDISAVSAGFVIDLLIFLITVYGKEPKEELIPIQVVQNILTGKYAHGILDALNPFTAEMHSFYLLAIPNDVRNNELVENIKMLVLYMQQEKVVKLYVNGVKASKLDTYFNSELSEKYNDSRFRVYQMNKNRFNALLLQHITKGLQNG